MNAITTCHSFPDLVEELRAAKKRGARLVSAAPDAQLGQAIGFKFSDGAVYRLTLVKVKQFEEEKASYPDLLTLWSLLASTDGRIKLFMMC
jgi:hypothetical protein